VEKQTDKGECNRQPPQNRLKDNVVIENFKQVAQALYGEW